MRGLTAVLVWLLRPLAFISPDKHEKWVQKRRRQLDFPTSTQRMGIRFTERLRDLWRPRWLKLRRQD